MDACPPPSHLPPIVIIIGLFGHHHLLPSSAVQNNAPVAEDARKCARITACFAVVALLVDLGLCGLAVYCVLLIAHVDGVPRPAEKGNYGWVSE